MSRRLIVVLFLALALATVLVPAAFAADPTTKQVGLVVAFPDGTEHLEIVTVPDRGHDIRCARRQPALTCVDRGLGPRCAGSTTSAARQPIASATPPIIGLTITWTPQPANGSLQRMGVGSIVPDNGSVEGFAWSGFDESYNPTVQPPVYTFAQIVAKTTPPPVSVPEPGTILLLGSGLAGVAAYVRLRKSR